MKKPVCVVVGVGPGNGSSIARRFAKEGYTVVLLARSHDFTKELAKELKDAYAYACDVSDLHSIKNTFKQIYNELNDIDVIIYNAGSGTWGNIEEITPELFELSWRVNTFGLFAIAQEVIPAMKQKGRGSIIIIGATASRRGGMKTAAFAAAKGAQRNLAESMAKYAWPYGIHVALVMIDGIVDLPKTREQMRDKATDFFVNPDDVASTVFWLTQQSPSAWSFEVEARPYKENW